MSDEIPPLAQGAEGEKKPEEGEKNEPVLEEPKLEKEGAIGSARTCSVEELSKWSGWAFLQVPDALPVGQSRTEVRNKPVFTLEDGRGLDEIVLDTILAKVIEGGLENKSLPEIKEISGTLEKIIYTQAALGKYKELGGGALKKYVELHRDYEKAPFPLPVLVLGSAVAQLLSDPLLERQLCAVYAVYKSKRLKIMEKAFEGKEKKMSDLFRLRRGLGPSEEKILADLLYKVISSGKGSDVKFQRLVSLVKQFSQSPEEDALLLLQMAGREDVTEES